MRMKATEIVPIACIALLLAAVVVNSARAQKKKIFEGVVLETPNKDEFYPDATDCSSASGRPYILVGKTDFERLAHGPTDLGNMDSWGYGSWKVKVEGNLSQFGVYGVAMGLKSGYWRQLEVLRIDDVKLLSCFESQGRMSR
jgi:hypothetical protein